MWRRLLNFIKNPWFIFGLIVLIAIVLRVLEINRTSFWYDEAFTGDILKLSWRDMLEVIAKDRVHPPTFYVLIRLWSDVFGITQLSLRSFSVFWGVSSVVAIYLGMKNMFDKNRFPVVGLILALMVAISPFFVTYSVEARAYSFIVFLALGLAYTILKFLNEKIAKTRTKYLILAILLAIVLCATHYLQVVYVIAAIFAGVIYKLVYTEKGINKKWLFICLGITISGILALIFLPIKQFVAGLGISGMWWISEIKWYELVRVYYSYFLGVVRYSFGVPPVRELLVSVPTLLLGGIMFSIHIVSYVFLLASKRVEIEEKRKITFLFFLSVITFLGFYALGLLGFNCFVERYTVAGGIILFISFWSIMSIVIRQWYVVIPVGIYLCFILMLKPMPTAIDYRDVAKDLDNLNNVERYVFVEPVDLINSSFYMKNSSMYYLYETEGQYSGWALLKDTQGLLIEDMKQGDVLIVPNSSMSKYVKMGMVEQNDINGDFKVLIVPN